MIRKMKRDEYLLLSRRTIVIIPAVALAVLLHGVIYGLFDEHFSRAGGDEAVFFVLVFLIPLYFIISLVYTVITRRSLKSGPKK
jgi:hypothetical protein